MMCPDDFEKHIKVGFNCSCYVSRIGGSFSFQFNGFNARTSKVFNLICSACPALSFPLGICQHQVQQRCFLLLKISRGCSLDRGGGGEAEKTVHKVQV